MKPKFLPLDETQATAYRDGRMSMVVVPLKEQPPKGYNRGAWYQAPVYGFTKNDPPSSDWWKIRCPFGTPGDQLRLGSAWAVACDLDDCKPTDLHEYDGSGLHDCEPIDFWTAMRQYESYPEYGNWERELIRSHYGKLRSSTQMPQWLRDRMPLVAIRSIECRRVQTIQESDIRRIGSIDCPTTGTYSNCYGYYNGIKYMSNESWVYVFRNYFNQKHKGAWDSNSWCWFVRW
jgi:hypothetical protein